MVWMGTAQRIVPSTQQFLHKWFAMIVIVRLVVRLPPLLDELGDVWVGVGRVMGWVGQGVHVLVLPNGKAFDVAQFVYRMLVICVVAHLLNFLLLLQYFDPHQVSFRSLQEVVFEAFHRLIELSDGQLVITSSNPDLGDAREELDIDYAAEPLAIGFNAKYLLDAINAVQSKEVLFSFQDELSPSKLSPPGDEKTIAVVMPMRI